MRVFFATTAKPQLQVLIDNGAKNILIAQQHRRLIDIVKDNPSVNLIVDSGAYTVWTKGMSIDLKEYSSYCKWLQENNNLNSLTIVNVDVIPGRFGTTPTREDTEKSSIQGFENYYYMKKQGVKNVMHIFHQGEDFKWLDELMKTSEEYVGISPRNDLGAKKRLQWLKKVFSIVRDKKKTHGFGITQVNALKQIPFFSADSSNWNTLIRFGTMITYNRKNFKSGSIKYKQELKKASEYGLARNLTSKELTQKLSIPIKGQLEMQEDITRLWKLKGINYEN
jgi:hypothetical protein